MFWTEVKAWVQSMEISASMDPMHAFQQADCLYISTSYPPTTVKMRSAGITGQTLHLMR
jgi:hypothetical protein